MSFFTKDTNNNFADFFIDITNDRCPMTFVKTKLQLEKMQSGQTLEVRLKGREPLENVPRSAEELGHQVINISPAENASDESGIYHLIIQRQ